LTTEEYFGMIINILMGLTLIVLILIFFYMVYGEKEEKTPSPVRNFAINIFKIISAALCGFCVFF